jgi:hypothetical protein
VEDTPEGVPLARITETKFCYALWLHVHVERRKATGDACILEADRSASGAK